MAKYITYLLFSLIGNILRISRFIVKTGIFVEQPKQSHGAHSGTRHWNLRYLDAIDPAVRQSELLRECGRSTEQVVHLSRRRAASGLIEHDRKPWYRQCGVDSRKMNLLSLFSEEYDVFYKPQIALYTLPTDSERSEADE